MDDCGSWFVDRIQPGKTLKDKLPCLFVTGPQPREEPRRAAERSWQRFISDEARPFRMIFQHKLARVKCFELGAVPNTDDGGFREPLQDQLHQLFLAQWVEGGGGLVHH